MYFYEFFQTEIIIFCHFYNFYELIWDAISSIEKMRALLN